MRQKLRALFYAYSAVIIWSAAYIVAKIGLNYFDPISLSIFRYFAAGVFAIMLVIIRREELPDKKDIPLFLLLGITGYSLYALTYNLGAGSVSVSIASIIISFAPISTAIGSAFIFGEKLSFCQVVAALIEFSGTALVCISGEVIKAGNEIFWIIASLISFTAYNLLVRFAVSKYSAIQITEYGLIASFVTFLPTSGYAHVLKNSVTGWVSVLFMGIICSGVAYILWSKAIAATNGTINASNALFLEPAITAILGIFILKEYPSRWIWIGIAINSIGLWMFYKSTLTGGYNNDKKRKSI